MYITSAVLQIRSVLEKSHFVPAWRDFVAFIFWALSFNCASNFNSQLLGAASFHFKDCPILSLVSHFLHEHNFTRKPPWPLKLNYNYWPITRNIKTSKLRSLRTGPRSTYNDTRNLRIYFQHFEFFILIYGPADRLYRQVASCGLVQRRPKVQA